ncbi:MAG TPA: hypothetical protein PLP95_07800, partial [Microthrixaceae bacterium]|nr:hypothetical protein [Microthrixaceae bacterium]
ETVPASAPQEPAPAGTETAAPGSASTLAIANYDALAASQVIPRLDGMSSADLDAVRVYERANRGRRTILSRIAQLQDG